MLRKIFPYLGSFLISLLLIPSNSQAQSQGPAQPSSQTQTPAQTTVLAPTFPAPGPGADLSYRIGPGDELDVRVFGRPELARVVRVDSYGRIRLPFLEELQAACMTEAQLAAVIAEKYKKYLRDPQVDVLVKDFRSQPVAVIGAVAHPGRFQLQRRVRLLELVTFAGGPSTHAGSTIHVIHNAEHDYCSPAAPKEKPQAAGGGETEGNSLLPALSSIKLKDLLAGSPEANPFVQPGDIVSIPEADQIFVTGSVVKPGAYSLINKLTLTQAVALAGGPNMEAARGKVRLVRQEPGKETRTETVYSLDDIHRRKIQDIALLPNDIIEVPSSTLRLASRNMLGVSINMLSALPYFIIR
jgi:polysaccharide export outer membrane protein